MAKLPGAIAGTRIAGERFVRSQREQNPEGRMPFTDHIRELRDRVVRMAACTPGATGRCDPRWLSFNGTGFARCGADLPVNLSHLTMSWAAASRATRGDQANSARYSWRNSATGRGGRPVIWPKVPVV
jgi:hypothetical protein